MARSKKAPADDPPDALPAASAPDPPPVVTATIDYERWLHKRTDVVEPDLEVKHKQMTSSPFAFLRATFYRWASLWPEVCRDLVKAPRVLAVGDLHVENFGTWRDTEGRLVWGVNDFDESWRLPYTNDLVRLATSALVAREYHDLKIDGKEAVGAILDGYREALKQGGHAAVLASLRRALPERGLKARIVHRVAGLGSLGRQRFVALAAWRGGRVAREAKALAPLAQKIHYDAILRRGVRCPDPCVRVDGAWLVRRLAPDCSRVKLNELPRKRDEARLLSSMGWETANVHLGTPGSRAIRADLKRRDKHWLYDSARGLADAVDDDWHDWRKANP